EAVEQAVPLFGFEEPAELGPVGGKVGLGEPLAEGFQSLFFRGLVHLNAAKTLFGLIQQVHRVTSQCQASRSFSRIGTVSRSPGRDNRLTMGQPSCYIC